MISFTGRHSLPRFGIYNMTKHSLVAFTDTLRRELYNLGVKVISIEPAGFKTPIISDEHVVQELSQSWGQSSEEVKTFYGSPDHSKKIMLKVNHLVQFEDNLDVCVDDMIDAINNCRPKLTYYPMRLPFRLLSLFLTYCPTALTDWGIGFNESRLIKKQGRARGRGIAKILPPEIENFQNTPLSIEIIRRPL